MRVASLNMRQLLSKCPSGLCLNTSSPHACRRCCVPGRTSFPIETYLVGVSYTSVCGRVEAYQVGKPSGYSQVHSSGTDGIIVAYGTPERIIWTFVAEGIHQSFSKVCPCFALPERARAPSEFISDHYFCDTAIVSEAKNNVFYKENP